MGHDLKEPGGGRRGGILGGEQEGEDGLGDFVIGEIAKDMSRLGETLGVAGLLGVAPLLGGNHLDNPGVHDAVGLAAGSHPDLGLGGATGELGEDHIGGLLAVPGLGEGDDDGEVDELEGLGDEVVVVGDLLDGLVAEVVTDKGAAGDGRDDLAELGHPGDGLEVGGFGDVDKGLEVAVVHLLLAGEVDLEGATGEEAVETLAEVNVGLAVEEDPVVGTEKLVSDIDDAGLDEGGRVKHLAGHVAGRGDDDKLVEDGNTAQGTRQPFRVVLLELGVDRFEEGADEGDLHGGTHDGALVEDIPDLKKEEDMLAECN